MADSWLSLARQDEAMDKLLAIWEAEPVETGVLGARDCVARSPFVCFTSKTSPTYVR